MTPANNPLREGLQFVASDDLLRDDVRTLGALVGELLAEQCGPAFLAQVEDIRRLAIRRREQGEPVDALAARLAEAPQGEAVQLVRAFAAYFGAINLAERVHRIRRRRDYQRAGEAPQPGGLEAVVRALKDDGVSLDELQACLARLHIEPVFTAHPTEAIRRVLLEKERTIVERLIADIDRDRTPTERRADDARIVLALTSSWQTSEAPARKPTVGDEVEHVGYYLANVLYRVLPVFYEALGDAIETVYGTRPALPQVLRFGTWVGGDMDGNPNVNADTMRAALGAQRAQALAQYRRDLRAHTPARARRQILPIDTHLPGVRFIQTHQQIANRRFAATRLTHKRQFRPRLDRETYVTQDLLAIFVVAKINIAIFDFATRHFELASSAVTRLWLLIERL